MSCPKGEKGLQFHHATYNLQCGAMPKMFFKSMLLISLITFNVKQLKEII